MTYLSIRETITLIAISHYSFVENISDYIATFKVFTLL